MKQWYSIIFAVFFSLVVFENGQAIEFETVRTAEEPGFFAVKLFPSSEMETFSQKPIFVDQIPNSKTETYQKLLEYLNQIGAQIGKKIPAEQTSPIIIIGEKSEEFLSFEIENPQTALEEFTQFQNQFLSPVVLKNVRVTFGGNITDIIQDAPNVTRQEPITLVGKFKKPMQTYLSVQGQGPNGNETYNAFIPLDDKTKANDPLANYLPELWENFSNRLTPTQTSWWQNVIVFPALLFLGGLIIVLWVIRETLAKRKQEKISAEKIMKNLPQNVKPSGMKPEDVPFEIVFPNESKN